MFRLWGKIWKNNRMAADTVICDDSPDTRTHKVFRALDEICYTFDLSKNFWTIFVPPLIRRSRSGSIRISGSFKSTQKSGFIRTVLSTALISIIWRSRSSRRIHTARIMYSGGIPSVIFSSSVQKSERRDNQRSALLRYPPHWR